MRKLLKNNWEILLAILAAVTIIIGMFALIGQLNRQGRLLGHMSDLTDGCQSELALLRNDIDKLKSEITSLKGEMKCLYEIFGGAGQVLNIITDGNRDLNLCEAMGYLRLIYFNALKYGVDPILVARVARAESNYRANLVSCAGARGVMQVMPATAQWLGYDPADLFEPAVNIEAGVRMLKWCLNQTGGKLSEALICYNAGYGRLREWQRQGLNLDDYANIPYRETRDYVTKITGVKI